MDVKCALGGEEYTCDIANKIEFYVATSPTRFAVPPLLGVLYHFISARVGLPRRGGMKAV